MTFPTKTYSISSARRRSSRALSRFDMKPGDASARLAAAAAGGFVAGSPSTSARRFSTAGASFGGGAVSPDATVSLARPAASGAWMDGGAAGGAAGRAAEPSVFPVPADAAAGFRGPIQSADAQKERVE